MFFGSPEHLKILRYEVLSPDQRYECIWEVCIHVHVPPNKLTHARVESALVCETENHTHIKTDPVGIIWGLFYTQPYHKIEKDIHQSKIGSPRN